MSLIVCSFLLVQNDEPVLSWNESNKLSWSDFKAQSDHKVSAVAITASGISFGFSVTQTDNNQVISFDADVSAHFYPEKSWFKPELADNHLLDHEQLHFDITELHARKFREQIASLKNLSTVKQDLRNLNESINIALAKMQNAYDDESDYSRNEEVQVKWEAYIHSELRKVAKYKSVD
ncbi:MAG: DUF922 domain-containing protein [Flavobacteriaceae bacterium]